MRSFPLFTVLALGLLLISSCKKDEPVVSEPGNSVQPTPYELEIPRGFPAMPIPDNNPLTVEGVELGRQLFYDVRLSGDNTQACASCHLAPASFSDSARFSTGITGDVGNRNAMAIVNLGYSFALFWDGRASTLEEQALAPVTNPIEMNATWPEVLDKLNADQNYRDEFKVAFGVDVIDSFDVAMAIAQFERTMISGDSKFDIDPFGLSGLSVEEKRGFDIFSTERGDCFHCHNAATLFEGVEFENNGLQQVMEDFGVGGVTGKPEDMGKFKPTTLRNIELTSPYMHDGRFKTLEEVIEFYNSGVNQNSPNVSPLMTKGNRPNGSLNLSPQEKSDLLSFLKALTDTNFTQNPDFLEN